MFDPLKAATAKQFPILNRLSQQQITNTATSSGFYSIFHRAGYSNAWIAADVLAWQQLRQRLIVTLPVGIAAIFLAVMAGDLPPAKTAQGHLTTLHQYPGELF